MGGSPGRALEATAPSFEVVFIDETGTQRREPLLACWDVPFERAKPSRSFPSFKGQKNFPGLWWSATRASTSDMSRGWSATWRCCWTSTPRSLGSPQVAHVSLELAHSPPTGPTTSCRVSRSSSLAGSTSKRSGMIKLARHLSKKPALFPSERTRSLRARIPRWRRRRQGPRRCRRGPSRRRRGTSSPPRGRFPELVAVEAGGEVGDLPVGREGTHQAGPAGQQLHPVQPLGAVDLEGGQPPPVGAGPVGGVVDVEAGVAARVGVHA